VAGLDGENRPIRRLDAGQRKQNARRGSQKALLRPEEEAGAEENKADHHGGADGGRPGAGGRRQLGPAELHAVLADDGGGEGSAVAAGPAAELKRVDEAVLQASQRLSFDGESDLVLAQA